MEVTFNKEEIYREHTILVCPYKNTEAICIIPKKGLPIGVSHLGIEFDGYLHNDTDKFADLIPGLICCNNSTWKFPKVINLSKVADKLIDLCIFFNSIETAKGDYIKNLFA